MSDMVMCARCGTSAEMHQTGEWSWEAECPGCGYQMSVQQIAQTNDKFEFNGFEGVEWDISLTDGVELGDEQYNDFIQYQMVARRTAIYPDQGTTDGLEYVTLGLVGEAGEVANQVKKIVRDDNRNLTSERRAALIDECGDVLWYLAGIADELGTTLAEMAARNVAKLEKRYGK